MKFNEDSRVKIPSILHLTRLGYDYLPLKDAEWNLDTNIFTDVFLKSVLKINNSLTEDEQKDYWSLHRNELNNLPIVHNG